VCPRGEFPELGGGIKMDDRGLLIGNCVRNNRTKHSKMYLQLLTNFTVRPLTMKFYVVTF